MRPRDQALNRFFIAPDLSEFTPLLGPILGRDNATHLGRRLMAACPETPLKLAYAAAFFLGTYNETAMPLTVNDWEEIRETLKAASNNMDLDTLTTLWDDLLSRDRLD
ncbi:MAG: hypothetical protein LBT11_05250 [Treponema sp.]|jgi:hypothetical protein|nr:hypothetical protein [Treponema sp.]